MAAIQVEVQGEDAIPATEELLAIAGVSGTYEVEGEVEREGIVATVAAIVGLVGGTLAIAEQISVLSSIASEGPRLPLQGTAKRSRCAIGQS